MSVAELPRPTLNEAAFIRQAKQICSDLMEHRPAIYWTDFLLSAAAAWTALFVCIFAPLFSVTQIAAFLVAGFLMYRSSVFTHELAHMPATRFRRFRLTWNLLFGIPLLMPSFLYTDHRVHHMNQTYGTGGDNEYFPFGRRSLSILALSNLIVLILPLLPLIRFGILGPVSLLHPKVRAWVWGRTSSLGSLSPSYMREPPNADECRESRWQEIACFAVVAGLVAALATGVMSWTTFGIIAAVYIFASFVNNVRVYAAHHYLSTGEPMTFVEQMLDSTTIPVLSGVLWAPLGMRYHAVHHLFPTMPYHAMGTAHRRLMRQLPQDSPYHQTLVSGLWPAVANLVRTARANRFPATPANAMTPAGK
jgi:fatty acid desaturase